MFSKFREMKRAFSSYPPGKVKLHLVDNKEVNAYVGLEEMRAVLEDAFWSGEMIKICKPDGECFLVNPGQIVWVEKIE